MPLVDLDANLGIIDVDLEIDLIDIDLSISLPGISTGTGGSDTTAGSQSTDVISTFGGDDIIIGSDGLDIIDGGLGIDLLLFDFSSNRHSSPGIARDVTITAASVRTNDGGLPLFDDVQTTMANIEGVILRFGERIGDQVIDTNDDSADASTFAGSEGVQFISGGGSDVFVGSSSDDIFSFLVGAGTATSSTADGGAGADAAMIRIDTSSEISVVYGESGGTRNILTSTGESIALTSVEQLAFTAENPVAGGSGGPVSLDARSATSAIQVDFTDGGAVQNYDVDFTVFTGSGDDLIQTNAGDDIIDAGTGNDTIDAGFGNDLISYASATSGVTVSLSIDGAQDTGGGGIDTLVNFEHLEGSNFDDTLIGNGATNYLYGLDGDDRIIGRASADRLYGGDGNDELIAGLGFDRLEGGAGNDTLFGNYGDDVLVGGSGDDILNGNFGGDTIYGDEGNDVIDGGVGEDNIYGGIGNDSINGAVGIDLIYGEDGNDTIEGGAGDDTIDGGNGSDQIDGGIGADTIYGGNGVDNIFGASGDDLIYGGDQADTINGGGGADELHGGSGFDTLFGEGGADDLYGENGDDTLAGGYGVDTLTGGIGADTFVFGILGHSSSNRNAADTISDFSQGQGDMIDLSAIDADSGTAGNQGFSFMGQAEFSNTAGELRYEFDGSGDTILQMDVDGDGGSDMTVRLSGEIELTGADFEGLAISAFEQPDAKSAMAPAEMMALDYAPAADIAPTFIA